MRVVGVLAPIVGAPLAPCAAQRAEGGEAVTTLDPRLRLVLQARDGSTWFGSNGAGAHRHDGQGLLRSTSAHGLTGDVVADLQEDGAGKCS